MTNGRVLLASLAILFWALPPAVAAAGATMAEVVDGDALILSDGTEVRLVGIQAPSCRSGARVFVRNRWPMRHGRRSCA